MDLRTSNGNYMHIALLTLLQLQLLPVHCQHYYPAQPQRPLYYDATPPRLRRYEYVPAPLLAGYVTPPAGHYQQQTPSFQLINYRPNYQPLALEYQQQQPPATALYPQQSVQYQQRAAPQAELAKYRYEGNYIPVQPRVAVAAHPPPRRVEEQLYNVPPALFTSDVLHVVPSRAAQHHQQQQQQLQQQQQQQQEQQVLQLQAERPRRFAAHQQRAADTVAAESRSADEKPKKETKYFHDIFMRFDGPKNARSHGHVLQYPKAQERRFESQRGTNRYKGEVIWTDRRGGHGEHRWDMAQGKL